MRHTSTTYNQRLRTILASDMMPLPIVPADDANRPVRHNAAANAA